MVDGNNVMGAKPDGWWRDRQAAVRRLLARLQCYRRATDRLVVLVLDVPQADLPEGFHDGVIVHYARCSGRDAADERILELLDEHPGRAVEVVTSDRALAAAAARDGVRILGARALLSRLAESGCWNVAD